MKGRFVFFLFVLIIPLFFSCKQLHKKNSKWLYLFNGENLDGWVQKGGEANYTVEDGMIVGTTVANTPNSFLCTDHLFGDFILELEVLVDTALNSGIQICSNEYLNGRIHGYQVEIDPSPRSYSGGIYDEARRGWLDDLSDNEESRKAFKRDAWNKYRIEAIGHSFKTWINGVMCANLVDEADDSGFIALQVHSVNVEQKPWTEGIQVKWRNIKILTEDVELHKTEGKEEIPVTTTLLTNKLTQKEQEEGWELLFDGETTAGWRGAHKEAFPEFGWSLKDGALTVEASGGEESKHGGDIVTINEYSNYDFRIEFRLTPGANSGIKYFVTEKEETEGSAIGLEYQILDDNLHPDATRGREGNRTVASLYDLIPAQDKYIRQTGQWNMARIVSKNHCVEHWLNGRKVLEYERDSEAFRDLVAISKYKVWKNFGEAESGHILLQDHGDEVSFRNIRIKEL